MLKEKTLIIDTIFESLKVLRLLTGLSSLLLSRPFAVTYQQRAQAVAGMALPSL
jgi:hypothetical protein